MGYTPDPSQWCQVGWQEQGHEGDTKTKAPKWWHKPKVPYTRDPNALQHVDVWTAATATTTKTTPQQPPAASWIPPTETLWLIFIHGGAWRDPLVTSDALVPALECLLSAPPSPSPQPVVLASISYSLSPYPRHPTLPSSPDDESRNASHPRHVLDVLEALCFLQTAAGLGSRYVLAGHSCGATLALQAAMRPARWTTVNGGMLPLLLNLRPPRVVLGLNGLYDLPGLCRRPGPRHEAHAPIYQEFTRAAFGDDEQVWADASPALVDDWAAEWPDGQRVILVHSPHDSLVPFAQGQDMRDSLLKTRSARLEVDFVEGHGDHDDVWRQGKGLADALSRAIENFPAG